jgi:methyl-accepting chemotaxis protein
VIRPHWTIRSRLFLGFGLAILALLLAGAVGIFALDRIQDDVSESVDEANRVGQRLFRIHDATLRLVALSQAELTGAASAGAHGRGFAVVAEQVRKLATDSAGAAEEVRRVVDAMRAEVASAVASFKAGARDLGNVGSVSRAAATALDAIDQALPGVQDVTVSVSRAAGEARAAVDALSERLRSLGLQAESQAAASEEAAAAAEETAAGAEEVAATARTLQRSADRLRGMIGRFEV